MSRGRTYSRGGSACAFSLFGFDPNEVETSGCSRELGPGDWILCQVTSNPYGDVHAIEITDDNFDSGSLRVISYARPGKLFTANQDLVVSHVAILNAASLKTIIEAVIDILRNGLTTSVQ